MAGPVPNVFCVEYHAISEALPVRKKVVRQIEIVAPNCMIAFVRIGYDTASYEIGFVFRSTRLVDMNDSQLN